MVPPQWEATSLASTATPTMPTWWQSLPTDVQIFYSIGFVALLFTAVQLLITVIGLGGDVDVDIDIDSPDAHHSSGIGLFSSHTIAAFLLGFGWIGGITRASGLGLHLVVLFAFAVGVALMLLMAFMLRSLLRLQSKGNLDYRTAIGQEGVVYVTIPGGNQDGGGQIQVMIQGRLRVASARKVSTGAIRPGEKVRIVDTSGPASFVVEPNG